MDVFDEEFVCLLQALQENKVNYIFVGGLATNLNGFSRMTADFDIWIKDEIENRKNFRQTLKDLDLGDFEPIETMQFVPGWTGIYLGSGIELDIMTELKGLEEYGFDECYKMSPTAEIHGIKIKFLHIKLLIENKKKVNRPKDQVDVMQLEEIYRKQKEKTDP